MAELGARADISIAEVTGKAAEVEALVGNKHLPAALLKALEDPPVLSKEKELKKVAAEAVFKVFDASPTRTSRPWTPWARGAARWACSSYVYWACRSPGPDAAGAPPTRRSRSRSAASSKLCCSSRKVVDDASQVAA